MSEAKLNLKPAWHDYPPNGGERAALEKSSRIRSSTRGTKRPASSGESGYG
jgi:hypothetical protein